MKKIIVATLITCGIALFIGFLIALVSTRDFYSCKDYCGFEEEDDF